MKPGETYTGKASWFGGPQDRGVAWTEGLALFEEPDVAANQELFLGREDVFAVTPEKDRGRIETLGLARRLNPDALYCAMRWDYEITPRAMLRAALVECWPTVKSSWRTVLRPVDWGPNIRTGRLIDVSFGALQAMGIMTDDVVACRLVVPDDARAWSISG